MTEGRNQLRWNIGAGVASAVVGAAVTLVSYPFYIRWLGYEQFGVWWALATLLNMTQAGNLGLAPALTKLVAEEYGAGNPRGAGEFLTAALVALLGCGAVATAGIILWRSEIIDCFRIPFTFADMTYRMLPWIALLSVICFVNDALIAALAGMGRADLSSMLPAAGSLAGTCASLYLVWRGMGLEGMVLGSMISAGSLGACAWFAIGRVERRVTLGRLRRKRLVRLASIGGWVFATSWVNLLLNPLNKILLARFGGIATLPLYELAWNCSMRVRSLLEVGLRALAPEISRVASTDRNRVAELCFRYTRLAAAVGLGAFSILIAVAPAGLQLWLGRDFDARLVPAVRWMLCGAFCSLLVTPAFYTLLGIGSVRTNFMGSMLLPVLNVLTTGAVYGLTGGVTLTSVSAGVFAGMAGTASFLLWQVRKKLAAPSAAPGERAA